MCLNDDRLSDKQESLTAPSMMIIGKLPIETAKHSLNVQRVFTA